MTNVNQIKLEESWKKVLLDEFSKPYFVELKQFLVSEINSGKMIFPTMKNIFRAFDACPFENVKVVILGQDPYHSAEFQNGKILPHAHGLCFSIPETAKRIPPSLQNIYKEIQANMGAENFKIPNHGNLEKWAEQGILLINATLTVEKSKPTSHSGKGWEAFTDGVIKKLSDEREGIIFLLWGNYAKKKGHVIDRSKHTVLTSAHPSPFSAHSGFFGCGHFAKVNEILKKNGEEEIDWQV